MKCFIGSLVLLVCFMSGVVFAKEPDKSNPALSKLLPASVAMSVWDDWDGDMEMDEHEFFFIPSFVHYSGAVKAFHVISLGLVAVSLIKNKTLMWKEHLLETGERLAINIKQGDKVIAWAESKDGGFSVIRIHSE